MKKNEKNINFEINMALMRILFYDDKKQADILEAYRKMKDDPSLDTKNLIPKFEKEVLPVVIEKTRLKLEIKRLQNNWPEDKIKELSDYIPNIIYPSPEEMKKMRERVDIGCPACKTKLIFVNRGKYETLDEHVSHPNDDPCHKDAYGCPNEKCEAHIHKQKWLSDGEGPFGPYIKGLNINWINNNDQPFRTWHRKFEAEKSKSIRLFKIWEFALDLKYHSKANENGRKNYLFTYFTFDLIINGKYYYPGINMFVFSLKQYYKRFDKDRSEKFADYLRWESNGKQEWWRIWSFNIAKLIWKKDYKKALLN